jgi:FkbM family methyltransferase
MTLEYRKNTDDDKWVIPEIIDQDMYKIKEVLAGLEPAGESYVIDCGAHIGAFSIMCSLHFRNTTILSFEPNPDSFTYLSKNTDKYSNIRAFNKAVDIKDGHLNLYAPNESEWSGRWTSIPNGNEYVTVESVDLFSLMKDHNKPVFILKLDIEGYEDLLINHSKKEDFERVHIMVIETHSDSFDHEKVESLGFRILFRPDIGWQRHFIYAKNL